MITEDMLTSDKLYREIKRLVNDEELLDKMSLCARNMAKTDALDMIYGVLREITKD